MSRKTKYLVQEGIILHAFNQGVEPLPVLPYPLQSPYMSPLGTDRVLFHQPRDYESAIDFLLNAQSVAKVSVLLHALLPDRIDLILHQHEPYASSLFMQRACQPFSCLLNRRLKRGGHYFHARFGIRPVPSAMALLALSYTIHLGPVDAGLIQYPGDWPYSSCKSYINGMTRGLSDPSAILSLVGGTKNYLRFLQEFDRANPSSAELFLCPEYSSVWGKLTLANQRVQTKPDRAIF